MATFGDGKEASVEASVEAVRQIADFSAYRELGCLTLAQCAVLIALRAQETTGDPGQVWGDYFQLACLDVSRGLLEVRHPKTLLPWSQYERMLDAGMFGPDGATMPMPDGSWLIDMREVVRWYETHGIALQVNEHLETDIKKAAENLPLPAPLGAGTLSEQQDAAILAKLRELGYEPTALPRAAKGKPGAKAACALELIGNRLFKSRKVFDLSWERLRSSGRIRDAPA